MKLTLLGTAHEVTGSRPLLEAAGKHLLALITASRILSNRELAGFTDQINSLCDKHLRK